MDRASALRCLGRARSTRPRSIGIGVDVASAWRCSSALLARHRRLRGRAAPGRRRGRRCRRVRPRAGGGRDLVCRRRPVLRTNRDDSARRLCGVAHAPRRDRRREGGNRLRGGPDRGRGRERRGRMAGAVRAPRDPGLRRRRRLRRPGDTPASPAGRAAAGSRTRRRSSARTCTGTRPGGRPCSGSHRAWRRRRVARSGNGRWSLRGGRAGTHRAPGRCPGVRYLDDRCSRRRDGSRPGLSRGDARPRSAGSGAGKERGTGCRSWARHASSGAVASEGRGRRHGPDGRHLGTAHDAGPRRGSCRPTGHRQRRRPPRGGTRVGSGPSRSPHRASAGDPSAHPPRPGTRGCGGAGKPGCACVRACPCGSA